MATRREPRIVYESSESSSSEEGETDESDEEEEYIPQLRAARSAGPSARHSSSVLPTVSSNTAAPNRMSSLIDTAESMSLRSPDRPVSFQHAMPLSLDDIPPPPNYPLPPELPVLSSSQLENNEPGNRGSLMRVTPIHPSAPETENTKEPNWVYPFPSLSLSLILSYHYPFLCPPLLLYR